MKTKTAPAKLNGSAKNGQAHKTAPKPRPIILSEEVARIEAKLAIAQKVEFTPITLLNLEIDAICDVQCRIPGPDSANDYTETLLRQKERELNDIMADEEGDEVTERRINCIQRLAKLPHSAVLNVIVAEQFIRSNGLHAGEALAELRDEQKGGSN